ncbi:MAG: hypothetical protein WDO24_00680 [Pseudomonadota bacterium]
MAGLRTEVETLVRQRFERLLADMDLVPARGIRCRQGDGGPRPCRAGGPGDPAGRSRGQAARARAAAGVRKTARRDPRRSGNNPARGPLSRHVPAVSRKPEQHARLPLQAG